MLLDKSRVPLSECVTIVSAALLTRYLSSKIPNLCEKRILDAKKTLVLKSIVDTALLIFRYSFTYLPVFIY